MTEQSKAIWHKVLAIASMAALIAIPIVSHSVFGGDPGVQLAMTVSMTFLASLGLTKVRPLAELGIGTLEGHQSLATALTMVAVALTAVRATLGMTRPWLALAIDIVLAVLGWAGVTVVKTPGSVAAAIARDKSSDDGIIHLGLMMVIGAIGLLLVFVMSGCTPTQAYVDALRVKGELSDTVRVAYQAWRAFDDAQQRNLVQSAATEDAAVKSLASWRSGTQAKVGDAFIATEKALATYSDALKADGAARVGDYAVAIADVTKTVADLLALLGQLGVTVPAPTSSTGRLLVLYDNRGAFKIGVHSSATNRVREARWHLQARMVALLGVVCRVDDYAPYCYTYAEGSK